MNPAKPTQWQHLAPNPKSNYKQWFVKGKRIRAEILYGATVDGDEPRTPEEVAEDYGLPLEVVKEAVAYCEANPDVIEEDHQMEERSLEAMGLNDPAIRYGRKTRPPLSPQ